MLFKTAAEEAREDFIHWQDRAKAAEGRIGRVREHVRSEVYPCPYPNCEGTITITWEDERDDAGYVLNTWPEFSGECGEMFEVCEDVCEGSGQRPYYPPYACYDKWHNHAEQLNNDYEGLMGYTGEILARASERRAVEKLLTR